MSSLRDRIGRLKKATAGGADVGRDKGFVNGMDVSLAGIPGEKHEQTETNSMSLPTHSRFIDTEDGRFIMRERRYSYDHAHGLYQVGELAGLYDRLTRVSKRYTGLRPVESHRRLLFFDTETTGLGIGAGNVPFMLGLGFYTEEEFVVQQLFVRNPSEEQAMLRYFAELTAAYTHLVTYNGRTFDWPIVANRFVLNRIAFDGSAMEHLDLLYISRSLWKHSLESCRLSKVEEERLGIVRENDLSGALAPMMYFQYLADGKIESLEGVFLHNELDVLTLATLASHLGAILSGSIEWTRLASEDLYRIGVWLVDSGFPSLADQAFETLLRRTAVVVGKYAVQLAAIYKKQRRYSKAIDLWEQAAALPAGSLKSATLSALQPLIELAMVHEHQTKRYDHALRYTEEALNRLERRLSLQRGSEKDRQAVQELRHRRSRLLAKASRDEDADLRLF